MDQNTGKYIILFGAVIIIAGILIYFLHDKLQWIGRLPGDIRVEKGNSRFYFPIVTMILFSLFISLIIYLAKKFF
ncbi:MAG: DUF2905 domain-containing protein [Chitinophagaceae bacterium]